MSDAEPDPKVCVLYNFFLKRRKRHIKNRDRARERRFQDGPTPSQWRYLLYQWQRKAVPVYDSLPIHGGNRH